MIEKASKLQRRIVEMIELIGDSIGMIEGLCKQLMKEDFVIVNNEGHIENNVYSFVISHRKYNIIYNELREELFKKLNSGYKIIQEKVFLDDLEEN